MSKEQPQSLQQTQWSKDFDNLPHHYEPIKGDKGHHTCYVERDAVLKFISEMRKELLTKKGNQ